MQTFGTPTTAGDTKTLIKNVLKIEYFVPLCLSGLYIFYVLRQSLSKGRVGLLETAYKYFVFLNRIKQYLKK